MMQIPNYVNPYMQIPSQQYATPAPNYNAVKIDVHNPSVSTPGVGQAVVNVPQQPQYAAPTMPYYTYPQAQLYSYPQTAQQPYYMPPQMQAPQAPQAPAPVAQAPQAPVEVPAPQVVQPAPQTVQPQVIQQNINTPQPAPEPVVTQQPAQAPKEAAKPVEIVPSAPLTPQVDLNAFIAKLTDPNYDVQASAMEEIANMVKDDPQKATELLDVKVMDALNNIVTDTIEQSCIDLNIPYIHTISGAGHDTMNMAELAECGMIFVRNVSGISHHKNESILNEDIEKGALVLHDALLKLSR